MVRSTCKVVVRLKPKDDPLDTAVQCIDNTAVCILSVIRRAAITSAIAFTSPKRPLCVLQEPTLLVRKGTDDDGLYQVRKPQLQVVNVLICLQCSFGLVARQVCRDRFLPYYQTYAGLISIHTHIVIVLLWSVLQFNFTRVLNATSQGYTHEVCAMSSR